MPRLISPAQDKDRQLGIKARFELRLDGSYHAPAVGGAQNTWEVSVVSSQAVPAPRQKTPNGGTPPNAKSKDGLVLLHALPTMQGCSFLDISNTLMDWPQDHTLSARSAR
jgi:hypothetical protein